MSVLSSLLLLALLDMFFKSLNLSFVLFKLESERYDSFLLNLNFFL